MELLQLVELGQGLYVQVELLQLVELDGGYTDGITPVGGVRTGIIQME